MCRCPSAFFELSEAEPQKAVALAEGLVEDVQAALFSANLRAALGKAEPEADCLSEGGSESAEEVPVTEDEAFLKGPVVGVDNSLARYVLPRCHGSRDAAAMLLIEHGSEEGLEHLRQEMRERELQLQQARDKGGGGPGKVKRAAARRYGERAVYTNTGKGKKKGKEAVYNPSPFLEVRNEAAR